MRCAICSGPVSRALVVDGHPIYECGACRHRMLEPLADAAGFVDRTFADAYFFGAPDGYPDYLAEEAALVARGRWYARMLRRRGVPAGRALEVGCAAGFVLRGFREAGWQVAGIEPNATLAAHASAGLGAPVRRSTLEALGSEDACDLVLILQVIAHLDDPVAALARARALLASGGAVLIETWDHESRLARWLGRRWHEYSPPTVRHWFSRASLLRAAERSGFAVEAVGLPGKWLGWRHAATLLAHQLRGTPAARPVGALARRLPASWTLRYPPLDLFWALLRRSD